MGRRAIAIGIVSAWVCAEAAREAEACATMCVSSQFCDCSDQRVVQRWRANNGVMRAHDNELIREITFRTSSSMRTRVRYSKVVSPPGVYQSTACETTPSTTHTFRIWGLEPGTSYHWQPEDCSTGATGSSQSFSTASLNTVLDPSTPNEMTIVAHSPVYAGCSSGSSTDCLEPNLTNGDAFSHILLEHAGAWLVVRRSDGKVVWYVPEGPVMWNDRSDSFVLETSYGNFIQEMKPSGDVPFEKSTHYECIQHEITMYGGDYYFLSAARPFPVDVYASEKTWVNRVAKVDGSTSSESIVVNLYDFETDLAPRASKTLTRHCQFAKKCGGGDDCVDWDHSNSIDVYEKDFSFGGESYKGGILISSRQQDQVTFYPADGSRLIWTLGLEGDFDLYDATGTLLAARTTTNGDPAEVEWFHDQHFARFIYDEPGKLKVLVYDNNALDDCPGTTSCADPYDASNVMKSRVFVLELVPAQNKATIVRRFNINTETDRTNTLWRTCHANGSATPLANDHFLVSCHISSTESKVIEYDDVNNVVWMMHVPDETYRALPMNLPSP